jgi:hypothetical protein
MNLCTPFTLCGTRPSLLPKSYKTIFFLASNLVRNYSRSTSLSWKQEHQLGFVIGMKTRSTSLSALQHNYVFCPKVTGNPTCSLQRTPVSGTSGVSSSLLKVEADGWWQLAINVSQTTVAKSVISQECDGNRYLPRAWDSDVSGNSDTMQTDRLTNTKAIVWKQTYPKLPRALYTEYVGGLFWQR